MSIISSDRYSYTLLYCQNFTIHLDNSPAPDECLDQDLHYTHKLFHRPSRGSFLYNHNGDVFSSARNSLSHHFAMTNQGLFLGLYIYQCHLRQCLHDQTTESPDLDMTQLVMTSQECQDRVGCHIRPRASRDQCVSDRICYSKLFLPFLLFVKRFYLSTVNLRWNE